MRDKKLWFVSEFYYPVITSTGYYITEIAEFVAKQGLDVNVICTNSNYNDTNIECKSKNEIYNNVRIYRLIAPSIDKNNIAKRTIAMFWNSLVLIFNILIKVKKGDHLVAVTNPAFLILFIPLIKKIKGFKYTLIVHDIFPENLAAIGKIKESSLVYKLLKFFFDKAYSRVDKCISIGRDMSQILKRKIRDNAKIKYIPNWADDNVVWPIVKEETHTYQQIQNANGLVFQFAGNLGFAQGLDNILKAIELLKSDLYHFTFIGSGAKFNDIKIFAQNSSINNISLLGYRDKSLQNDFLNACDIAIVTLNDGMFGLGVPSKAYNIMAAGKPILLIADKESEIALCIKEHNLGWIVSPNDPLELKMCIEQIFTQRDHLKTIGDSARATAKNIFSKEKILREYFNFLNAND